MLNDALTTIYDAFTSFYNPDTKTIKIDTLDSTYIETTTLVAQNFRFKGSDGTIYDLKDISTIISELQNKIDSIHNITKEQIDSLE